MDLDSEIRGFRQILIYFHFLHLLCYVSKLTRYISQEHLTGVV